MGRPKAKIDPHQVEQLSAIFCTPEEIAAVLGCSRDTLDRRFAKEIQAGKAKGRMSLRRAQYKVAVTKETPAMLIWLGKNNLGQKDKSDEEIDLMKTILDQNNNVSQDEAVATARGKRE